MMFAAPKSQISTKRASKTSTATKKTVKTVHNAEDGGMSMTTNVVFEEIGGPEIQVETMNKVRSSTALKATRSQKPAPETPQPQQKVLRTSFASSPSRTGRSKRVKQTGLGPGQYDVDAGTSMTKSRAISPMMSKTGRPDINKRV